MRPSSGYSGTSHKGHINNLHINGTFNIELAYSGNTIFPRTTSAMDKMTCLNVSVILRGSTVHYIIYLTIRRSIAPAHCSFSALLCRGRKLCSRATNDSYSTTDFFSSAAEMGCKLHRSDHRKNEERKAIESTIQQPELPADELMTTAKVIEPPNLQWHCM